MADKGARTVGELISALQSLNPDLYVSVAAQDSLEYLTFILATLTDHMTPPRFPPTAVLCGPQGVGRFADLIQIEIPADLSALVDNPEDQS